ITYSQRAFIKKKVKDIFHPWRSQTVFTFQDALFRDKFAIPIVLTGHNYMCFYQVGYHSYRPVGMDGFLQPDLYRRLGSYSDRSTLIRGFQAGRLTLEGNLSRIKSRRLASCTRVCPGKPERYLPSRHIALPDQTRSIGCPEASYRVDTIF